MIDYLVHFYKRDGEPFQSLSALPDAEAIRIMQSLYVEGSVFWERFKDPAWYLQARRQIEQWMVAQFIAKGGAPRMQHPIYLVLGWTKWLRKGPDATTRPRLHRSKCRFPSSMNARSVSPTQTAWFPC